MQDLRTMTSDNDGPKAALARLRRAAVEWAAGGRGQPLVDVAADAVASGLDSPSLRMLAGATRVKADEEAAEFGPDAFQELGIAVNTWRSDAAILDVARMRAEDFLNGIGSPRSLAAEMYRLYVAARWSSELHDWCALDDAYTTIEQGYVQSSPEAVARIDHTVRAAALALARGEILSPMSPASAQQAPVARPRLRWSPLSVRRRRSKRR